MEKRKRENVEESVLGETAAVRSRSAPLRSAPSAHGGAPTQTRAVPLSVAAHDPSGSCRDVVFSALFSFKGRGAARRASC